MMIFPQRGWTDFGEKVTRPDAQIAEYAASVDAQKYYPDPENPGGIKELSNRGLNVVEVVKGKGSVQEGIDRVRQLFMRNQLFIHTSCVNLIIRAGDLSLPGQEIRQERT